MIAYTTLDRNFLAPSAYIRETDEGEHLVGIDGASYGRRGEGKISNPFLWVSFIHLTRTQRHSAKC